MSIICADKKRYMNARYRDRPDSAFQPVEATPLLQAGLRMTHAAYSRFYSGRFMTLVVWTCKTAGQDGITDNCS